MDLRQHIANRRNLEEGLKLCCENMGDNISPPSDSASPSTPQKNQESNLSTYPNIRGQSAVSNLRKQLSLRFENLLERARALNRDYDRSSDEFLRRLQELRDEAAEIGGEMRQLNELDLVDGIENGLASK